jgi:catechol 2,3-dioxygenase-like lactoylglutathione lyase family enzyme
MAGKGLKHIALKTRDLKKTEEFYTGVLGMKVAFRHPPKMLFLTTPGSGDLINFVKSSSQPKGAQSLEHLGFKVTEAGLKKTAKVLRSNNVEIIGRRGKTAIYFRDPNGYQIEYYCD